MTLILPISQDFNILFKLYIRALEFYADIKKTGDRVYVQIGKEHQDGLAGEKTQHTEQNILCDLVLVKDVTYVLEMIYPWTPEKRKWSSIDRELR